MMTMAADGTVQQLFPPEQIPTRRQDAPPIFAVERRRIRRPHCDYLAAGGDFITAGTIGYVMPKDRSSTLIPSSI